MNTCPIDRDLENRYSRRERAFDRAWDRREAREAKVAPLVGELCREGRTVHYINQTDRQGQLTGRTVEFHSFTGALDYLLRNNYG